MGWMIRTGDHQQQAMTRIHSRTCAAQRMEAAVMPGMSLDSAMIVPRSCLACHETGAGLGSKEVGSGTPAASSQLGLALDTAPCHARVSTA